MQLIAEQGAGERGRRLWLERLSSFALLALPATLLGAFLVDGAVPTVLRGEAALVFVLTLIRPSYGLILVAATVPLGEILVPLLGVHPVRHAETLVVAFLAGWLVVRAVRNDDSSVARGPIGMAIWVFSVLLVTSVAATAMQLHRVQPEHLQTILRELTRSYLVVADDSIGAHAAGNLLQGLGLVVAVAELSRRERWLTLWLPAVLVVCGVVVSVASGLLALGIGAPATLARHAAIGLPRYSAAQADVNAAASYSLLLLGVSIGLAAGLRRTRLVWLLASLALAGGLALSGSRTAFVAGSLVVCMGAGLWVLRSSSTAAAFHAARAAIAIAVTVAAAAGAILLVRAPSGLAGLGMRYGFTQASFRMIAARPVFGVGAGRYYQLSSLALPPSLGWWYGRENAHDYFLQTAAELGPVGLIAFGCIILAAFMAATPSTRSPASRPPVLGWLAGSVAYLATCVSGHPFLVPETAVPFWMVLGLLGAGDAATTARALSRGAWPAAIAITCVLAATVPFRRDVPNVRLPAEIEGFGPWRTDEHGVQFHEVKDFASLYVVPNVTELEIRFRVEKKPLKPVPVLVAVPAGPPIQIIISEQWSTAVLNLPEPDPLLLRQRINLAVDPDPLRVSSQLPSVYVSQPRIVATR
jgi:O-antigen ligase